MTQQQRNLYIYCKGSEMESKAYDYTIFGSLWSLIQYQIISYTDDGVSRKTVTFYEINFDS